ncbi:MAG: signal recognition particle protein [Absicoccus sp.]|uniref:Signal recognition particle protein n=1 Tax=Absicoccus intestinalis TaxID=2926319 RepID=A0ABU4WP90_9FIRM|nr:MULTISPECIES: signal recognition particle protein [unclassified Absicoccus]MDX8418385.1 signal recognition particle protein [Absicoccus sp. CLA-KB-P134]MDY3036386.1 signal recognition particle protein [Absicoccus sp.]
MAFESLSDRLSKAMRKISGQGKLTEKNMNDMLKEVRMSLLEADVNYDVVKNFVADVKEKALGQEVMESLNPSQMVVKIVHDEVQTLLGEEDAQIHFKKQGMTTIMMVGLQGTGKTTASAKIAKYCKEKLKKRVLLVACDVVRPAAIEQLQTLGKEIDVEVFSLGANVNAVQTARQALDYANDRQKDLVIFDTAGRLHIDEALMQELSDMKALVQPDEILLTVDAMTGQDIVTVAKDFNEQLSITGLVVTKLDGDARGGGLLSVRSITQVPVLFVSNGEKVDDLEAFHPDRMADRILGMGDVMTLVEQAQERLDMEVQEKTAKRMQEGIFTFNDMLDQFGQVKKMGSIQNMMKMVPGLNKLARNMDTDVVDSEMKRSEAIIQSMTPYERDHPEVLKASRKNRIAKGSGVKVADVNKLIKQLEQMQSMTRMMSSGRMPNMSALQNMQRGGGLPGGSKHAGSKKMKKKRKKKRK